MLFEWDEKKNRENRRKHGINFEYARKVFLDENRIERLDTEHSWSEERIITIGLVDFMVMVVYTERRGNIRIISARSAEKEEMTAYYEENDIRRR